MKYLPIADLDVVTSAVNFSTPDCHVIGGCDLYTTKAAGRDKKLYKDIENSLESQYESLVRLSASLSPPAYRDMEVDEGEAAEKAGRKKRSRTVELPEINLSRDSPFGPLSQITARRTYAYLIATLNASHPDYDFSHILRPTDFHKVRLRSVMDNIDSTLQNLRPRPKTMYLAPPMLSSSAPALSNSSGNEIWSPRMWTLLDREMGLKECDKYSYVPEDDPFEGGDEGGAIWSMHYFFFNKERKRVCYLYLRGLSVISHSPVHAPTYLRPNNSTQRNLSGSLSADEGAGKRASYWLGNHVRSGSIGITASADDDDDEMVIAEPDDDEVEVPQIDLDDIRSDLADGYYSYDVEDDEYAVDDVDEGLGWNAVAGVTTANPARVRGVSEEIGDVMEL